MVNFRKRWEQGLVPLPTMTEAPGEAGMTLPSGRPLPSTPPQSRRGRSARWGLLRRAQILSQMLRGFRSQKPLLFWIAWTRGLRVQEDIH